jgi:hypothetical protein
MRFKGMFYALSVVVNSQPHVYAKRAAGSEFSDSKLGNLAMLGSIPGSSIRGWLRAGINKLLIQNGIKGVHPLMEVSISAKNKTLFSKDLHIGYIPRDSTEIKHHPVFHLFGTLGKPGNIAISPVYFYPTTAASGFRDFNELFDNRIGTGFVETGFNAPTCQHDTSQKFLKTENLRFNMIKAPIYFTFWSPNLVHEALLVKGIEFLNLKNSQQEFEFLFGGNRRNGAGEVRIRLSENMRSKSNNTGLNKVDFIKYEKIFTDAVVQLKKVFPLENQELSQSENSINAIE